MTARFTCIGLLLAATALAAPTSAASAAGEREAGRTETRLHDAVQRYVKDAGLAPSLENYRLDSNLVQLRRYVDGRKTKLVCVVDLALTDRQGSLFASVRGNATTIGASADEALDAAAHSAVSRLPEALRATKPKT